MDYISQKPLQGHQGAVLCVKFNREGNYCVSGGQDRTIRLWNPHKGNFIKSYNGHGYDVADIDVSDDNSKLASCGGDRTIFLWDVADGRTIRKFRGHEARSNCVKWNSDCSVLASGSYDSTVRLWDCKSNSWDPIQILGEGKDSITSIDMTSYEILTGSVDGCVRSYDIRAGQLRTDLLGSPVTCVNFSHDRNCILASTTDSKVRLFDKPTGELLNEYTGHTNQKIKVESRFTTDDAYVVSGSEDNEIYVWDLIEVLFAL